MFENILVVGPGNVCRSPVGEALLRKLLPDRNIQSAGLGALVGKGADTTAVEIAKEEGLDLGDHRSRQITKGMIGWANVILVMSEQQRGSIREIMSTSLGKTMLFGQWLPYQEIHDPYLQSREAYVHTQRLLSNAASEWMEKLK
jgi:protein-tyrosine phosphatase